MNLGCLIQLLLQMERREIIVLDLAIGQLVMFPLGKCVNYAYVLGLLVPGDSL